MPRKIEISHKTIVFTILLLMGLWFVYFIRDILFQLFVALFLMVILHPTVKKLSRYRIPKSLSVLIVYVTAIAVIVVSLASIIPALVEQLTTFSSNLPRYLNGLGIAPTVIDQINSVVLSQVGTVPAQLLRFTLSIFSNLLEIVTVLIFAFYLLMSRDRLPSQLAHYIGEERASQFKKFIDSLEIQLGGWARGQLALMVLVGSTTYVGLFLLGVPYAVPLAVIAGLLEAVPYVGPIISAVPAAVIGFGISPVMGFATIALAFLIQQIEASVFVPKVMEKSAGVNPIITLLALAIGFRLAGIGGMFMSVPVVIALKVFYKEFIQQHTS